MEQQLINGDDYQLSLRYRQRPPSSEDTARNEQNLLKALDAMVAGDESKLQAIFDPDVTLHEAAILPYGGAHRGIDAMHRAHAFIYEAFDRLHFTVEQVMSAGDLTVLYMENSYRVRKNGRSGTFLATEVYRFRDGKVIEWRPIYFDAEKVAADMRADD